MTDVTPDDGERAPDEIHGSFFAIVPEWILSEPGDVVKLYAILDRHANKHRKVWPGQAELAERLGCSERQVRRYLTSLRELGALEVVKRRYNGTTIYVLHKDPVGHRSPERPDQGVLSVDSDRTGESALTGHGCPPNESHLTRAKEPKICDDPVTAAFDEFWSLYPLKRSKGQARKAWPSAVKRAGGTAKIMEGAARFAADPHRDPKYTAHPATWLNGERWDDPPLPSRLVSAGRTNGYRPPPIDDDRSGPSRVLRPEDL